jgi:hypothetical protein
VYFEGYNDRVKNFEFLAGALCLDFLNTLHEAGAADPGEELESFPDLCDFAVQARVLSVRKAADLRREFAERPARGGALLSEARNLRTELRAVFEQAATRGLGTREIHKLNSLLEQF